MRLLVTAIAVLVMLFGWVHNAAAQTVEPFALDRFEPSPAGDRFFAVPGADAAGHGRVSAAIVGDYAYRPLVLYGDYGEEEVGDVVSNQLFVHVGVSLGLFERLQVSLNAPFALVTTGESPSTGGVDVASPS